MGSTIAFRIGSLLWSGFPMSRLRRQEGQTLAEYALILALIAIIVIVALTFLQSQISTLFSKVGNNL